MRLHSFEIDRHGRLHLVVLAGAAHVAPAARPLTPAEVADALGDDADLASSLNAKCEADDAHGSLRAARERVAGLEGRIADLATKSDEASGRLRSALNVELAHARAGIREPQLAAAEADIIEAKARGKAEFAARKLAQRLGWQRVEATRSATATARAAADGVLAEALRVAGPAVAEWLGHLAAEQAVAGSYDRTDVASVLTTWARRAAERESARETEAELAAT